MELTLALPPVRLTPVDGANFGRGFQAMAPLAKFGRAPLGTGEHAMVVVVVGATVVVVEPATVVVVVELVVVDVVLDVDDVVVDDVVVVVVGVTDVSALEKCPVRSFVPPEVVQTAPCDGVMLPRKVTAPPAARTTMPCTLHVAVPVAVTLVGPWVPGPWPEWPLSPGPWP